MNILVLRALGLGDALSAVPALRGLRQQYPQAVITVAAPGELEPLLQLSGAVDGVVDVNGLDQRPPPSLHGPDLAVNLHGRGPQSIRWLAATAPRKLLTYAHAEVPEVDGPLWPSDVHERAKWTMLVNSDGAHAEPSDVGIAAPADDTPYPGAVVLHVGAAAAARRWPVERFGEIAAALGRDHHVVITGGAAEIGDARMVAVRAGIGEDFVLAGRLSLVELAALVGAARLVISGDTGVSHLASAYGTDSVTLFGPTPPSLWGPPDNGRHIALWAGRTGDPHGDACDAGLLAISPDEVLGAAEQLMTKVAGNA